MQLRTMLGGLFVAGVLSVGCGGPVEPEQNLGKTEQSALSCPAGYTLYSEWECGPVQACGNNRWGNYPEYFCTNGTDTYSVGTGPVSCGDCF